MSKGSGGTRATNSRSAHQAATGGGKLSNGNNASSLTDKAILDAIHEKGNGRYSKADRLKIRQEAELRATKNHNQFMESFDKNLKSYEEARAKFENDFKKKVAGGVFGLDKANPVILGPRSERVAIAKQITDAKENLRNMESRLISDSKWVNFKSKEAVRLELSKMDHANDVLMKRFNRKLF